MTAIRSALDAAAVRTLLRAAGLPDADVAESLLDDFLGAYDGDALAGVIGVERYGEVGLLRSLAVDASRRGSGLGKELVAALEAHAQRHGVIELWLLTTTAETFFAKLGYAPAPRDAAPPAIRGTREFTTLCPASAVVMRKQVGRAAGS